MKGNITHIVNKATNLQQPTKQENLEQGTYYHRLDHF